MNSFNYRTNILRITDKTSDSSNTNQVTEVINNKSMNSLNEISNQNSINLDEISTPVPKIDKSRQKKELEKSKDLTTPTKKQTGKSVEAKKSVQNLYEIDSNANQQTVSSPNYIGQSSTPGPRHGTPRKHTRPVTGQYLITPTNSQTENSETELTILYEL